MVQYSSNMKWTFVLLIVALYSGQSSADRSPGSVRLVSSHTGNTPAGTWEGRLEYYQDQWGSVCDSGFNMADAEVVCTQLGYPGLNEWSTGYFGLGTGPIYLTDIQCTGDEERLDACPASTNTDDCDHDQDVSIRCLTDADIANNDFDPTTNDDPTDTASPAGVGDDPHMIVHLPSMDRPLCFEFDGYHNDIYQLVHDRVNGFVLNAQIFTPDFMKMRQTFFNKAFIGHGERGITISLASVTVNGVSFPWESLVLTYTNEIEIARPNDDTIIVKVAPGIEVTVNRDFSKTANHLDVFMSKSEGLSELTSGLVGEFLTKPVIVEPINRRYATLTFPNTGSRVTARLARRPLMRTEGFVTCWEVEEDGEGVLDSSLFNYLVPVMEFNQPIMLFRA